MKWAKNSPVCAGTVRADHWTNAFVGMHCNRKNASKKMLASGQTPQAIVDAYISEFGLEILSKPPAKGFNLVAWIMPPLVLLLGFFGVRSVLRTWSKTKSPTTPASQPARDDPYLDRLESDLKERE